jgi:hypothetical protein
MTEANDPWVVLVAALVGGLVGSILQPIVVYLLDKLRSRDTIRERREQTLRGMITSWIGLGRRLTEAWRLLLEKRRRRIKVESWQDVGWKHREPSPWDGQRIQDEDLRKVCQMYHTQVRSLYATTKASPDSSGISERLLDDIDKQRIEKMAMMDELNYPEVDDQ